MKNSITKILAVLCFLALITAQHEICFSQEVSNSTACKVAVKMINQLTKSNSNYLIKQVEIKNPLDETKNLGYIFLFEKSGYIVVSADKKLPTVIAYSDNTGLSENPEYRNKFIELLQWDLKYRKANISKLPEKLIAGREMEWDRFLSESKYENEQYDYPGEILLKTNWSQGYPYNLFCPLDPVTGQRSVAGCPAVAMAQIVNYFEKTNSTQFDDTDDYYMNYAGRHYWIDDDYLENDFPSFPQLDGYLDTLKMHYQQAANLTNEDKAALNFACGVAAKQVYTSQVSGTFGVEQAYSAYQRFGFEDAELLYDNDTSLFTRLKNNILDGSPVHLAVVTPQWDAGHNVVVDGVNEVDYYHINFGWGGTSNGWYLIPDEIPYGLTVIEGIILDIDFISTDIEEIRPQYQKMECTAFPNPFSSGIKIELKTNKSEKVTIELIDNNGKVIRKIFNGDIDSGIHNFTVDCNVDLSGLTAGIYFINVTAANQKLSKKIIYSPK